MAKIVKQIDKSSRLTNYMEELAGDILGDLLAAREYQELGLSDDAVRDVKALALNRLWPMYTTTTTGKDFLKKMVVEDHVEKDVMRELRAAIDIVRLNPR